MPKLIVFSLLLINNFCLAQGGWNIGYVEIDSINESHIGIQIKLDFVHRRNSLKKPKFDIRGYVIAQDTAYILIGNTKTVLYEKRFVYVDQGFFEDQFLEIENYNNKISLRIENTELLVVEKSRIKVKVSIKSYEVKNNYKVLKSKVKEFWINKERLDGVMIRY